MQYKNLGRSGLRVSQLSYGAWVTFGNQLDVKEAKALLQACRDAGVNFFDNAEVYANGRAEEIMGQAIRDLGWRRSDVVISTKLFWGGQGPNDKGLSRKHIVEGLKGSLKRLDMDYVDVVYCHRPDASTPIEETVRAMNWVIDQGWAFYWGTSEWSAQQITEAWAVANRLDLVGPIVEQPEYNLFSRHKVSVSRIFRSNSLKNSIPLIIMRISCHGFRTIPSQGGFHALDWIPTCIVARCSAVLADSLGMGMGILPSSYGVIIISSN